MDVLQRLRRAIRDENYRISTHANDEMADDLLIAADVERIILTGRVVDNLTHDERGTRYVVLGDTIDNRKAFVIC